MERGIVERLAPDPAELRELWEIADRSLWNARARELTEDGTFLFAYMAARTLATLAIRAEGYRVTARGGGHFNTFEALRAIADERIAGRADYLDDCRRKRNETSYVAVQVTRTEAQGLLRDSRAFRRELAAWMRKRHPALGPPARRRGAR